MMASILSLVLLSASGAAQPGQPRVGLVEEWAVRSEKDSAIVRVEWTDSLLHPGGVVDWKASIRRTTAAGAVSDSAVLRFFDLDPLLDSGVLRGGSTASWARPSCLLPFERSPLDSAGRRRIRNGSASVSRQGRTLLAGLVPGALEAWCVPGGDTLLWPVETGDGRVCVARPAQDCEVCASQPLWQNDPELGLVRWRSPRRRESWDLRRRGEQDIPPLPGRAGLVPHPGEAWSWTLPEGSGARQMRIGILAEVPDSAGLRGWKVFLAGRDTAGRESRVETVLRLDTLSGRVRVGEAGSSLWAPSTELAGRLVLGFLSDWTVSDADSMRLFEWRSYTSCFGHANAVDELRITASREGVAEVVTRALATSSPWWPPPTLTTVWNLTGHDPAGVGVGDRPKARFGARALLCDRLRSDPRLLVRRATPDGRVRQARGAQALPLVSESGVAIVVVGEGPGARPFRIVNP